ncbi:hypothetical protein [Gracilibacillus salinarum]|uniref:Uncharacterized protein n=1 Tax=Gracilibacillus salinarum TaxID=2932255 RepID=A0ABY4GR62_9BACI|nr:hypothetical protein [Gracilibacillus salinarum]UOQ85777.1 hypothetical protein MUN87_02390 [Gracilibacillus salinarum]
MKEWNWQSVIEWIVAMLLLCVSLFFSSFFEHIHFSAEEAMKQSEKTFDYGPSEISEVRDFENMRFYLGKYKDWFSLTSVKRNYGFLWSFDSDVGGVPIDESEAISYGQSGSQAGDAVVYSCYGIKNNPQVTDIEVDVHTEEQQTNKKAEDDIQTYRDQVNDEGMFLINWEAKNSFIVAIRGLDKNGKILYQEKLN